jgi:excisionase family DNA binding protein
VGPQAPRACKSPARELLNIDAAAIYLNVGTRFVRRLVDERRVRVIRIGRHIRFDRRDLDQLIVDGTTEVSAAPK